ncbi:hypothetical protein BBW65_02085 [Helicobacter enhydrae]|uniref:Uncharacterized protein n=1 Tax=Helicobacter enhydrae TaxID=222136 RepID=A0A1B1U4F6_9HELI|nr:hypothetical protein BBW65_02085 [Helicobacter enhydrae]
MLSLLEIQNHIKSSYILRYFVEVHRLWGFKLHQTLPFCVCKCTCGGDKGGGTKQDLMTMLV